MHRAVPLESEAVAPVADSAEHAHTSLVRFSLLLLGAYVFLHNIFAGEILGNYLQIRFPLVAITGAIVAAFALYSWNMLQFFKTPLALPWILLCAWMVLASAFSYWPGVSVRFVIPYGLRFGLMPFLFCALAVSTKAVRDLLSIAAAGLVVVLFLCVTKGQISDGRLVIPGTDMLNPNDLAFHLVWISMLATVWLRNWGASGKILWLATIPLAVWYMLKTGSRANFLTFLVLFAVVFLMVPRRTKTLIALGGAVIAMVALMVLPRSTLKRMLAIDVTASQEELDNRIRETQDERLRGAIGSQAARMELQRLAIDAALRHPLLGVGPMLFEDETAGYIFETTGEKAPWQTAHNSYLKIASENGIVGFIFYIWVIVVALRVTYRAYRHTRDDPTLKIANTNSAAILLALIVYAFGSLFCDIVYLSYLSMTLGFAAANYLAVQDDERRASECRQALQPAAG